MKLLYTLCLLVPHLLSAQNCLSGIPVLNDNLPCMERALGMDGGDMRNKTMEDIIDVMCDHKPFARGNDVLAYIDSNEEVTATILFTFDKGKCAKSSITLSYKDGHQSRRDEDVSKFKSRFNSLYNSEYDPQQPARYSSRQQELRSTFIWKDTFSYVRLDVAERRGAHVLEIERSYR